MPAKDTFGSQPPLELIRQWIDYGFWYDRLKQIVKNVKVCQTLLCSLAEIVRLMFYCTGYVPSSSHGPSRRW